MESMKTLSLDLRERIVAAYDAEEGSREEIGHRFRVSLGMVKKLLQQRRRTGDIGPRHFRSGRKPRLLEAYRERLQRLLAEKPDLTLEQMRSGLAITCSLPAIHYVLEKMGLTYKKRRSGLLSRIGRTSSERAGDGSAARAGSIQRRSSSSTSRGRRPT